MAPPHQREEMQQALMKLSSDLEMDFSFQLDNMYRRMRRLICFDMDSTLIQTECIDELAERAGVGDQVREITERAMRGEIDFIESFTERVALLKGLDESVMKESQKTFHHRRCGTSDVRVEKIWLQNSHPIRWIHLFW